MILFIIFPVLIVPLMLVLLAFAFYPAIYPTKIFFKKRGEENVVIEYQYLKKILYISLSILIALIVVQRYFIDISSFLAIRPDLSSRITMAIYMYYLLFLILPIPLSIIIKLLLEHARKEFRFYYAKGCFRKILTN
jgi:hypothetical protein